MSELGDRMRDLPLPPAPSARAETRELGAQALERSEAPRRPAPRGSGSRLRPAVVVPVLLALLVGLAFTPPGKAVTGEIGDLVGIGEVGGPPTNPSEVGRIDPATDQIVLAAGETADGIDFEIVAFRSDEHPEGREEPWVCVNTEFPSGRSDESGSCYSGALRYGAVCCSALILDDENSAVPRIEGEVHPDVDRVEVSYVDAAGDTRRVEAVIGMITPAFAKQLKVEHPSGLFVASLPDLAEQAGLPTPLQGPAQSVQVAAYGADGQVLETEYVKPVGQARIDEIEAAQRFRETIDERKECLERFGTESGRPTTIDADDLSERCRKLLTDPFD